MLDIAMQGHKWHELWDCCLLLQDRGIPLVSAMAGRDCNETVV